ncbi:hypothetical protein [Streptomyces gardneri]|uniref:hypothetical protein n=1 Tax=Streptomyces gardneri TaxID=66892 RepID=UPI0035DC42CA
MEQDRLDGGVCVVRCIGGIARVGQRFRLEDDWRTGRPSSVLVLARIERYGRSVDFLDPAHSALIHLSGGPLTRLWWGSVLVSYAEGPGTA